jgi:membrane fusion protein, multidrug efflux system
VPSLASLPHVAGSLATLLTGLTAAILLAGCTRNPAPPAGSTTADSKEKAAGAVATASKTTEKSAGTPAKAAPSDKSGATSGATPGATSGRRGGGDGERGRQAALEQVPVETAAVMRGPISAFLSFNSTLETEATVDIYPQTTGQVELLFVEEGRIVKAGDPLLKIEDRELRVDVEESTANFEHLSKNFARTEELFGRNLINKQDHDNQRYQVEQARLRLERAKIRLSYTTVRAPFAGVIATRETQVGARVTNGTKVFSMVKLDDIVARVFVPGRYLAAVKEDQSAIVTSEFLPDRTFKGWVKRISPVIDPKSGTFKVTVGVRGEKPSDLPPGLFVGVRVITDTRDSALLIPKRAVVYEGGERYVFTVVNGQAVKRKLVVGYEDPQHIEAVSGFEVGTPIIVLGHNGLKDRAAVRIVNALTPIPQASEDPALTPPAAPAKSPKSPTTTAATTPSGSKT